MIGSNYSQIFNHLGVGTAVVLGVVGTLIILKAVDTRIGLRVGSGRRTEASGCFRLGAPLRATSQPLRGNSEKRG